MQPVLDELVAMFNHNHHRPDFCQPSSTENSWH